MDEFGTLTESFGIKPQGKSAPMAASRRPTNPNTTGTPNFGFVSGVDAAKQHRNSNSGGGSFLGDPDVLFRSSGNQKTQNYGNSDGFGDIFGGPIKNSKQSNGPSFDYDSIFNNFSDSSTKSSLSVHDKLVYDDDDDIFGVSALKSSAPAKNNNVFGSFASSSNQTAPIDDLLGNFGRMQSESNILGRNGSGNVEENANGFDDLIPGFGGSSPPKNGVNLETSGSQQSSVHSGKSTSSMSEDPFLVLESTSTPVNTSSGLFSDPFEQFNHLNYSGGTKLDGSSNTGGVYDAMDPLDGLAKSTHMNGSPLRTRSNTKATNTNAGGAEANKASMKNSVNRLQKKVDTPLGFEENLETADDAWLKFSEIPHFKQPASASPPRPLPPKRAQVSKEDRVKSLDVSLIDELEDFAMGGVRKNALGSRPSSVPRSRATTVDSLFETQFHNVGGPQVARSTSSGASTGMKKAPSMTSVDDLSLIFFGAGMSSEVFEEVEGESEERRRARMERHQRTQERVAKAVSEKNQRDLQTQREQEERHRIAETLNGEIKRWAAGKEGNLRALLSTLHLVLGTECGWQPVSLTDMITSASVKKVFRKANLCIHPDKVQQKGANLRQKCIAEKVFDVLQEAWNKFNSEELS